jgi:hypothetical protein
MDDDEKREKEGRARELKQWMEGLGCRISEKVWYPHVFDGELYGMVARETVEKEEVMVLVKPDAIFSTELLQGSLVQEIFNEFPVLFGSENTEALDNQFLTLLLYEKSQGENSKWKWFIRCFPEYVENLCDWTDEEKEELQDRDLVEDSKMRKTRNLASYLELQKALNQYPHLFPEKLEVKDIEYCWKIIWTRSFMRSTQHSALIPYADFINHGNSMTGFYFTDQKEEAQDTGEYIDEDDMFTADLIIPLKCKDLYEINVSAYEEIEDSFFDIVKMLYIEACSIDNSTSAKNKKNTAEETGPVSADFIVIAGENESYQPGSQILFEYGSYSNTSLLTHYGFAIPNNRCDYCTLKIQLKRLISVPQQKHLSFKYEPNGFVLFQLRPNSLCHMLLRVLRALSWTPKHRKDAFFSQSDLELEMVVLGKYEGLVREKLNSYRTTIEEDRGIVGRGRREKFAVFCR